MPSVEETTLKSNTLGVHILNLISQPRTRHVQVGADDAVINEGLEAI